MTPAAQALAAAFLAATSGHHAGHLMHLFYRAGLAGLIVISTIDSSFVPLPIPGVTDILIILYAANHANLILLVALATIGSALGGFLSHWVGHAGGMAFLEKHVSKRYLKPVQRWVENHAILSVAVPAILPPPVPLSPFVLVAGAVKMDRKKFMIAFTASRFTRHVLAAWLGVHYGKAVLHLWNHFSERWAATILIVFWSATILFTAVGIWKLVQTSRGMKGQRGKPVENAA